MIHVFMLFFNLFPSLLEYVVFFVDAGCQKRCSMLEPGSILPVQARGGSSYSVGCITSSFFLLVAWKQRCSVILTILSGYKMLYLPEYKRSLHVMQPLHSPLVVIFNFQENACIEHASLYV